MTSNGLAAFYNACCNEHRFEDLPGFVARDVVINGVDGGLDAYADGCEPSSARSPIFAGTCATIAGCRFSRKRKCLRRQGAGADSGFRVR